ncbi:MAG: hypothetical protein ACYDCM_01490 [Candidatus Acidiferrales bacterium]
MDEQAAVREPLWDAARARLAEAVSRRAVAPAAAALPTDNSLPRMAAHPSAHGYS